jgi:hypothetical protein
VTDKAPKVEAADETVDGKIITTAKGRKLTLRELGPMEMLDLLEAAGSNSSNDAWVRMAMLLCSVAAIDGTPQPMATTKMHVRSMGKMLGNDGLVALNKEFFGIGLDGEPTTDDTAAVKEALATAKN